MHPLAKHDEQGKVQGKSHAVAQSKDTLGRTLDQPDHVLQQVNELLTFHEDITGKLLVVVGGVLLPVGLLEIMLLEDSGELNGALDDLGEDVFEAC